MEASTAEPVVESSFLSRHQFLIYRLFSLSGLLPIGGYLCVHLLTNATILDSPATFQKNVNTIHSLGVVLPLVEWVFIFIPILFHATVGWLIISGAVPNTSQYPYANNIRYTLQRGTGIIAFFFIVAHVIHLHHTLGGPFEAIGGGQFDHEHASSSAGEAIRASIGMQIFYAVGMLSVVYHFANGLWSQGITWGLWTTAAAQKRANWISILVGVPLAIVGLSALWGMKTVDVDAARATEDRMLIQQKLEKGEVVEPAGTTSNSHK